MFDLTLDYHSHVLPGCDHGSDSLETSLAQLALAKEAGVGRVCATPHFYPQQEDVETFLCRRQDSYDVLQPHQSEIGVSVTLGAEVLVCEGMAHMPGLRDLCRQGTDELLLEMPFYEWPRAIVDTVRGLVELDDITVVLAHVDRYPPKSVEALGETGALMQVNAEAIANHPFGRRKFLEWSKRGWVRYLGSDIHMIGNGYNFWKKAARVIKDARCAA